MAPISNVRILSITKHPGDTLRVDITIQNTGNSTHTFNVGCSIGRADVEDGHSEGGEWHDVDIYNDGFGEYVQITLNPGESGSVYRTFYLDPNLNPENWNDVWARALDASLNELDSAFLYNEFEVLPIVEYLYHILNTFGYRQRGVTESIIYVYHTLYNLSGIQYFRIQESGYWYSYNGANLVQEASDNGEFFSLHPELVGVPWIDVSI